MGSGTLRLYTDNAVINSKLSLSDVHKEIQENVYNISIGVMNSSMYWSFIQFDEIGQQFPEF